MLYAWKYKKNDIWLRLENLKEIDQLEGLRVEGAIIMEQILTLNIGGCGMNSFSSGHGQVGTAVNT
jgi:hypothetical protein